MQPEDEVSPEIIKIWSRPSIMILFFIFFYIESESQWEWMRGDVS